LVIEIALLEIIENYFCSWICTQDARNILVKNNNNNNKHKNEKK